MLSSSTFFGSYAFQLVTAAVAGLVVFLLIWFLLGTAARARKDKAFAARMKAIGRPQKKKAASQSTATVAGGWIPDTFTSFGQRFAERQGFSERLDAHLEAAGFSVRSGEFVIGTVGCALLGATLGAALLGTPLMAIGVGALCALVPNGLLKVALKRRAEKLREQLPDVLTVLASSLRAGHSFMQALDTVAKEIAPPAAGEFQRVVAEVRLGRPVEEALEALAERVGSADFRWAVLAVNIQREVGGNLAEILDTVADTLRERAMMRRQVRVLTAEGRLSAYVLGLMPVAILLLMLAENKEYVSLLWTTTPGLVMLIGGASFLVAGLLWMRKIVDIDV